MNLFIIGDVHGCFHTFSELLTHRDPATEHLIQVGDLVDRGATFPKPWSWPGGCMSSTPIRLPS